MNSRIPGYRSCIECKTPKEGSAQSRCKVEDLPTEISKRNDLLPGSTISVDSTENFVCEEGARSGSYLAPDVNQEFT